MKIRRKLVKPAHGGRPLYLIGYTSGAPILAEVRDWFDREYGGPLTAKDSPETAETGAGSPLILATHGPWNAGVCLSISAADAEQWRTRLNWSHPSAAAVIAAAATPRHSLDLVLHGARLARGLTLLTNGTAYDVATASYLNPSDWTDRSLDRFQIRDHVTITQGDAEGGRDWFYTRGLSKFGMDDLETFRPLGLPTQPVTDTIADIADEIVQMGRALKVGATLEMQKLGLSVRVIRHRTAFPADVPLILREIDW